MALLTTLYPSLSPRYFLKTLNIAENLAYIATSFELMQLHK